MQMTGDCMHKVSFGCSGIISSVGLLGSCLMLVG
ncbi:hypothetical protein LINGRAPRIM_LOCUS285 [Linum grandiflorum]